MCHRGSRAGAGGREFAGSGSVEGGVRGFFSYQLVSFLLAALFRGCVDRILLVVNAKFLRYTSSVRVSRMTFV